MSYLVRNLILCVLVLGGCLLSIFPVDKNLRLGKDLAGGVSLVYALDVRPDDPADTVDRTIAVLKDRVNPDGLFEISMVQQGRDRIEISMPLPNERVRALRAAYEDALRKFAAYELDADSVLRAMRLNGQARTDALTALANTPPRAKLLEPVSAAAALAETTRAAYEAAKTAGKPDAELLPLLDAAGDAEAALEVAREKVLDSLTSVERLRAAMDLPAKAHKVIDRKAKNPDDRELVIPSPRDEALASIRAKVEGLPDAEATLQAVADAQRAYAATRIGFDDPNDLIRLLQGAGVLDFRIGVAPGVMREEDRLRKELRERGPENTRPEGAGWYPLNSLDNWYDKPADFKQLRDDPASYFAVRRGAVVEKYGGAYYMLLHDVPGKRITKAEGEWSLTRASPSADELGRPSVAFRMDPKGSVLMGELTQNNIKQPMAMVLDDLVYSTATIQGRISNSGQISGNFDNAEINYLIKTLNAGSLRAKLSPQPISQSILAPELGLDNLQKGLDAAWIALICIGVFMCGYYFTSGAIAMIALFANAVIILGIMSLQQAAFTLPGIAGVVLTFGTAVDANVLIYERIREELRAGADPRQAVRTAFKRVGSTIVDANVTNLIVCVVLVLTGTQEIRGFGITLGIGVVATLFCALIVTRLIFVLLVDELRAGSWVVSQLPIVIPGLQRLMTPRVDWMRLFPVFAVLSTLFVGMGIFFVAHEGSKLLDSEFRGGTSITIQFKPDPASPQGEEHLSLARAEVEDRVHALAKDADPNVVGSLAELRNAEIVPINPRNDGVTSDRFTIRTTITDERLLRESIVNAFGDVVESTRALAFNGSDSTELAAAPVFPIVNEQLGRDIAMPEVINDVSSYLGGVAILLKDLSPPPSKSDLNRRLESMRVDAKYSTDALKRDHTLIVLEGDDNAVKTAVIVVQDSRHSVFEDEAKWRTELAGQEWEITREALTIPTVLAAVSTFEPAIARTFRAQAIVAVVLSFLLISVYVWVRFGSVRYSLAAVIPLVHDTLVAIGMVALAEIVYENFPGFAAATGIRPIKIDLGMVAAIMTIIGYSLNDTIVILDRIRENRGKLAYATREVINESINQTMSRTFITAGTALVSLFVLYIYGGEGISSFAYTMICGMIVGTYSTIAIAAPIVYQRHSPPAPGFSTTDDRRDHSLPASAGI
jgi:SecD/SecF fusion protein